MYPYKEVRRTPAQFDISRKWNLIEKSELYYGTLALKDRTSDENYLTNQSAASNIQKHNSTGFRPFSKEKTFPLDQLNYCNHEERTSPSNISTISSSSHPEKRDGSDPVAILSRPCFSRRQQEVTMYSSEPPYMNTYNVYQIVDSDSVITEQPTSIMEVNSDCPTHSTSSSMPSSAMASSTLSDDFKDPDVVTIGEIRDHMCYYILCCGLCCD